MKRFKKVIVSLGIVSVLAAGSTAAFAKGENAKQRVISGSILSIDRDSRTITVRDLSTAQSFKVRIPDGGSVKTSHQSHGRANFEQLIEGMIVRDMAVR